jgi:CDP-paratose synthetase
MSQSTIIMTGATGFVGSHVLELLVRNRYKVAILKRSSSDTWRISKIINEVVAYNINTTSLEKPFQENEIFGVIHLATCYGRDNETSSQMMETNVLFPLTLLELANRYGATFFINTDTFFDPNYEYLKYYSLSKRQFVEWLNRFDPPMKKFNLRLHHVFGEKDDPQKFITWIIDELLSEAEEIRLTKGEQKRDFIYIRDVAEAYLKIVNRLGDFNPGYYHYDIGSGESTSIKNLVNMIKKITGNQQTLLNYCALAYRENEIIESKADLEKIESDIGWVPKTTLKEGLTKTVNWHLHRKADDSATAKSTLN